MAFSSRPSALPYLPCGARPCVLVCLFVCGTIKWKDPPDDTNNITQRLLRKSLLPRTELVSSSAFRVKAIKLLFTSLSCRVLVSAQSWEDSHPGSARTSRTEQTNPTSCSCLPCKSSAGAMPRLFVDERTRPDEQYKYRPHALCMHPASRL